LDLRWRQAPESAKPDTGVDACGVPWQAPAPAGAFMDFAACGGAKNPPHEQ
jgi:hypothetical protein